MNPSTVRDGLKANLTTITGLRCYDTIPDSINVPAGIVGLLSLSFDQALKRGLDSATVDVTVLVSRMSERSAQNKLDSLLASTGANSIKTALESDTTLSGSVSTSRVLSATPTVVQVGGIDYLAYSYNVEIYG